MSKVIDSIRRFVTTLFKPMKKKHVVICVGHSRKGDKGAINVLGIYEWHFNKPLADRVANLIREAGHMASVISRYDGDEYGDAMVDATKQIKTLCADVALELHFNSSKRREASGHEWLYWHSSQQSKSLAESITKQFIEDFPNIKSRGLVARTSIKQNGGRFLRDTHCPAVICEPFFGSNPEDTAFFYKHREDLAKALATAVLNWISTQ